MPRSADHKTLRHHHNLLLLCVLALFVILGYLGFKYLMVKDSWREHAVVLQNGIQQFQTREAAEEGNVIGTTIVSIPSGIPMIKVPSSLENYVMSLGDKTNRDIVILDKNKKILADTKQANVGQTYNFDNGEIVKTVFDGIPRSFIEKSADFPDGITEEIVQLKDNNGTIVGAVLISPSNAFNN